MWRLEASKLWIQRRDLEKYVHFSSFILSLAPSRSARHIRCVFPAYFILALLTKHKLLVKHMFFR